MEVGLEVGPLHDRKKTSIPKSQVNFINFIAMPLWEVWDVLSGGNSPQLKVAFIFTDQGLPSRPSLRTGSLG